MVRFAETVQKTFHGEILEDFVERPIFIPSDVEKALANGRRRVHHKSPGQRRASRYGRMIFSTRQTRAQ